MLDIWPIIKSDGRMVPSSYCEIAERVMPNKSASSPIEKPRETRACFMRYGIIVLVNMVIHLPDGILEVVQFAFQIQV